VIDVPLIGIYHDQRDIDRFAPSGGGVWVGLVGLVSWL